MATPAVDSSDRIDPRVLRTFLAQVKGGDFTARLPLEWTGVAGKVAAGLNDVVLAIQSFEAELARVGDAAGEQGMHIQHGVLAAWIQSWSGSVESISNPIGALARPTVGTQRFVGREAGGDASKVSADVGDDMLERYLNVVLASGRELQERLNNLLDLAMVESGNVAVEMTDVSLAGVRQVLLNEFEDVAEERGLVYSVDLASDTPADIVTDPHRLRQVLENLLANAFEHTTIGEVDVLIGLADDESSYGTEPPVKTATAVAITVRDTGVGIEPEQHQLIFDAFAQVDSTPTPDFGGAGLGLPISRSLVGLLGGEITVTTTQGEGSTFTVYLPLGLTPTSAPIRIAGEGSGPYEAFSFAQESPNGRGRPRIDQPVSVGVDDQPLAGMKVLVVDDDSRNLFAMRALLERSQAEVLTAEGGSDGIAVLEQRPDIDLVLMDIMMPGMDGYETMRAIRIQGPFNAVPIIAVTGKVVPGERERCIAAGANDFLPKPVDTQNLLAAIAPFLPTGQ